MLEKNVVSDKAVMRVILPNKDDISLVKMVIYDNVGNVVFNSQSAAFVWDLTNNAKRFVANGTYLIVAEVKGGSGKIYVYSAKLGIKR
jgi:flagellar hook assembly protein FlgD